MELSALIAEQAPGAFSVSDLSGTYRWVSEGFVSTLGYTAEHLVGRDAYELIHPDDHPASQEGHQRLFEQDEPVVVQCRLRAADGTYRWVETASRLDRDRQLIVASSRWVEGKQSAVETLQVERELAGRRRALEQQHRQFLTAVSHRARHPVTVIRGMTELLLTHADRMGPERRSQLLERIDANAERLAELVEDVTQAEHLARRTDRVKVRPIDLHGLVRDVLAEVADADAPVTVTVPPDMVVFGDEAMVRVALKALLENAIAHTPVGTAVWVQSSTVHDGTVISVKDAGPGVDPVLHEAIFEPFHRGDPSATDPGLGLGLHAVAEIAAVHGGRVWVADRDGGGAAFHLLLPTAAAHTVSRQRGAAAAATTAPAPQADDDPVRVVLAPGVRVLVVDDDPVVTELVAMALEADGFVVDTFHDGARALERVTQQPPDILICDVRMPEIDGRELVRAIRATPGVSELPIILCSALTDDENQWRSWSSGADSFVAKPFSPDHLVHEICRVLTARGPRSRQRRSDTTGRRRD